MKHLKPWFLFGVLALPFAGRSQFTKPTGSSNRNSDRTISYELDRNEPSNMGLFGLIVTPVYLGGNRTSASVGGGIEGFYSYKSHLRITAGARIAYADNFSGDSRKEEPVGDWNSYGIPVSSKKSSRLDVLAMGNILSWEKEKNYHIVLGSAGYRTVAVTRVRGKVMKALTGRLGYQFDNCAVADEMGVFSTKTPAYTYYYQGTAYRKTPSNFQESSTMMQSGIIVIGFGLSTFRDIKISLDDETYKGRREERSQSDLFVDFLYANKLSLQDMIYYHSIYNNTTTDENGHLPQRLDMSATPLSKTGFRIGWQQLGMYGRHFGTKFGIEAGVRPGIKTGDFQSSVYGQVSFSLFFGGKNTNDEE
jgi:hypothetical protein